MRKAALILFALAASAPAELPPVQGQDLIVTVKRGTDLYPLARDARLALEHVAFANRQPVQLEAVQAGRLRLPLRRILPRHHPGDGLLVNLPERGLYFYRQNVCQGFYPVAIGRLNFKTPTGKFKIKSLQENPTWIPPEWAAEEAPVPPGPDNPLGDRWIGLSAPGLGLHATNAPSSVGGAVSHSCLRTYPKLAHELFPQLRKGMPVWIVYEPVKFGRDRQGRLCVQVFPDVYQRHDRMKRALAILQSERLRLSRADLRKLLAQSDGVTKVLVPKSRIGFKSSTR